MMITVVYSFFLYWLVGGTLALIPISGWLQRARLRDPVESEAALPRP